MLFSVNHFIAILLSLSRSSNSTGKSLFPAYIVLSSAKFANSASSINKNKSFINILKRIGPSIDP